MSESYTTYAITDPRTTRFFYVGQTRHFEKRRRQHLAAHRLRKITRGTVQHWLKAMHQEGHTPLFTVLELVETEEESLVSETKWVEKLSALGHPLFNRWREHKEMIEQTTRGMDRPLEPVVFGEGKPQVIGRVEANAGKTGLRIHVDEGVELIGPVIIDLLPPKMGSRKGKDD